MKKYLIFFGSLVIIAPSIAAQQGADRRTDRIGTMGVVMAAHNPVRAVGSATQKPATITTQVIDMREAEKDACTSRNVGMGNIFVWASKNNNGSYESMVEDLKKPENNFCFVRVTLKSKNPKITINESSKYFTIGGNSTCGNWVNEEKIKQQILDSKKSDRVGGTIAGVVGGAVVGVGTMELIGNKAIGGKVEGQKSLTDEELLRSQMLAAGKENEWKKYEGSKKEIVRLCDELRNLGGTAPECDK